MDFIKKILSDKKTNEELLDIISKSLNELKNNLEKPDQKVKLESIKGELKEFKDMIDRKEIDRKEIYQKKRNESKISNDFISKETVNIPQQRGGFIDLYDKNH